MSKIFNTIILTTLLILGGTATVSASWQLPLDTPTPDPNSDTGTATNRLTIGTDPTATDAYDNKFDTIALLKGPMQAYIPHPEYASEQQKLWRDIRTDSLPKEWTKAKTLLAQAGWRPGPDGVLVKDGQRFRLTDQDTN